jgi:hypothetical protein
MFAECGNTTAIPCDRDRLLLNLSSFSRFTDTKYGALEVLAELQFSHQRLCAGLLGKRYYQRGKRSQGRWVASLQPVGAT